MNTLATKPARPPRSPVRWLIGPAFSFALVSCLIPTWAVGQIPELTTLAGVRRLAGQDRRQVCSLRLEGVVRATIPGQRLLFLQDDSGAEVLELDWGGRTLPPGTRISLAVTNGSVTATDFRLRLSQGPVAGNDASHPMLENSGQVYLEAGRHPMRVAWFNWTEGWGLVLEYAGPGLTRQRLPASALWRAERDPQTGAERFVNGLHYRCFEGDWTRLPDFSVLAPVKTGALSDLDPNVKTRDEHAGVEFTGLLEVPRAGRYTFFVTSDDGCQVFLPEAAPRLDVLGSVPMPTPVTLLTTHQLTAADEASRWAVVEGEVEFITKRSDAVELSLAVGGGRLAVKLLNGAGEPPAYLIRSRVRASGVCQAATGEDGLVEAGTLIVPGWNHFQVLDVQARFWSAYPTLTVAELQRTNSPTPGSVRLRGKLRVGPPGEAVQFVDQTGTVSVQSLMPWPDDLEAEVEVLGQWRRRDGTNFLGEAILRAVEKLPGNAATALPLLTTAEQVQRLKRDEAARHYPVRLRGVLTWVSTDFWAVVIQDNTRAIYVRNHGGWPLDWPELGEYWEIEGVSDPADFSPVVEAQRARRLRLGRLPEPVRPTWDQLLSGTLDAQYVELQGIVTAAQGERVTLLTRAGKLTLVLFDHPPPPATEIENALVRVRGCLFPQWDGATHRVKVNLPMRMGNSTLTVDETAPLDPFAVLRKSAAELLVFDSEASALQRVKVAGQIVHVRPGLGFLMDGAHGLRFVPREQPALKPGDQVEVVGFPELSGPSPVLREALVRKIGQAALPQPLLVKPDALLHDELDATLVRVEGVLLDRRSSAEEQMLEVQTGLRIFVARLRSKAAGWRGFKIGSRLELTGVFAGYGGNRVEGREIDSFELLLSSPAAVRVLAAPPWWTLERLLVVTGVLLGGLALALVWIKQLRRKVGERTAQLAREIEERERAEQRRMVEQERTRVAQDLHDELGSGLTEVSMLGALARNPAIPVENKERYLDQLTEAARSLVTGLDEIVWAVNPQYDSTASLATYYSLFAQRFLNLAGIACRLEVTDAAVEHPLEARLRHGIFLAFKEALNNVVRHSGATEVRLAIVVTEQELRILIADNGRGFAKGPGGCANNGLAGLHQRMQKLGGDCEVHSRPGEGTTVAFRLPLEKVVS